jgi:hypothetical protein
LQNLGPKSEYITNEFLFEELRTDEDFVAKKEGVSRLEECTEG